MKERDGVGAMVATNHITMFHSAGVRRPWSVDPAAKGPDRNAHRIVPVYWIAAASMGIVAWAILLRMI